MKTETPKQPYQPKTGLPCSCKRGQQRDNCPACEGTGMMIDFAAIRARHVHNTVVDAIDPTGAMRKSGRVIFL